MKKISILLATLLFTGIFAIQVSAATTPVTIQNNSALQSSPVLPAFTYYHDRTITVTYGSLSEIPTTYWYKEYIPGAIAGTGYWASGDLQLQNVAVMGTNRYVATYTGTISGTW